ncbi:eukaryotic translation initiation factor 5 isoform X2 [Brevipalpus obovatus]|uniref:eukaryotic translation initiation factor 5 isoform X2 n=1 Tax=Brevipalpus obovatus TaxID=246614 RepID=UPI003D9EC295
MASVNVNRNLSDQFYRYKMPKLLAKVEGKGNGIKTVIVNMVDIAKALNRPPMYPTKYFGCVLGAQVNYDPKNERYIVNGSHESGKLQDLLDGFISKYVLCSECKNPETILSVRKGLTITTSCKACGHSGPLDNKDRLTTYILKNPPATSNGGISSGSSKDSKQSKRSKKDEKSSKKQSNGDSQVAASPNDTNGVEAPNDADDDDDGNWGEMDAETRAKRMSELSAGVKSLVLDADSEKSSEERVTILFNFIKKSDLNGVFDASVRKEILAEADRLDLRDKAVLVLCELLFNEDILQQIKTYRNLFLQFTRDNPKAEKYLLRGVEQTVQIFKEKLLPKVPHILKAFWEGDVLSEEAILDWGSKTAKKSICKEIRAKAEPFLVWLETAEEEESDSDGSNAEIEVVYDERCRNTEIKVEETEKPKPLVGSKSIEEDNDLDIDAI